ncbi:MAG: phenylalanine--tRNA ligase subunit beta, partial [Planctomycetota bacterium]
MLVSFNWLRDFVELPADFDPRALAERFTRTAAEVDGVHCIAVAAQGLIAARIENVADLPGTGNRRLATLHVGGGKTVETVTIAPLLPVGRCVVYAPPGASIASLGELEAATVAGRTSTGMILPGEALGIEKAIQEAIVLGDEFAPGQELPAGGFDDWVMEIDNKSITNRPDLWGHYGIAREVAAILRFPLKPYPVTPAAELRPTALREIPIKIADATACPRYSGITVEGVPTQPAPLWMQLRLGHCGQRPISGLVDLTNYIMMDLGQPMHAFDAAKVDRVEVDRAKEGERFHTLDGVERTLVASDLMIQCTGRSVALAGVMGGLETEVGEATTSLLLESANFQGATIRRTARRLALRSEASARFEKSLDPANTVLAIQRFVHLARSMYPKLKLTSGLSDAYPRPMQPATVEVRPGHVARTMGREVSLEEARRALAPLGFSVTKHDTAWRVGVPTHRATGDVSIEADVVEEIARCVGYDSIEPAMPQVVVRQFPMNRLHELEQQTLRHLTGVHGFHEVQGYVWYDQTWLDRLGVDPGACLELRNPAAEGQHRLRRTLMPNLLAVAARNRF